MGYHELTARQKADHHKRESARLRRINLADDLEDVGITLSTQSLSDEQVVRYEELVKRKKEKT